MRLEEAIEYALAAEEPGSPASRTPEQSSPGRQLTELTRREREVASLVARGLTNRQIAKELVISKYTVDNHLRNILKKLGLDSREQVAAQMDEHRRHRLLAR